VSAKRREQDFWLTVKLGTLLIGHFKGKSEQQVSEKVPKPGMGRELNFKIEENIWKHLKGVDEAED
jgi:hypothetical protein